MIVKEKVVRDQNYINMRNSFIPNAEKYANDLHGISPKGCGDKKGVRDWGGKWNKSFSFKMNELVVKQKLLSSKSR